MNRLALIALLCAALCAVPAVALAASGGTQYGDPAVAAPTALPAGDAVLLGHVMHVRGTLPGAGGETVVLERREADGPWVQAATAVADASGSFDAAWKTDHSGHFDLRARPAAATDGAAAAAAAAQQTSTVTVFRRTVATWFGPGFYGHRTACGQRLSHRLLGVANRTLPCGTKVALLTAGARSRSRWSTAGRSAPARATTSPLATAQALGVTTTSRIGAVRVG